MTFCGFVKTLRPKPVLIAFLIALTWSTFAGDTNLLRLWYTTPAEKWTDALPIGNGRLGAMVFGGIDSERIQFNEDTLWKGHPHDYVRAGAHEHLADIRRLLAEGNVKEAENLARQTFLSDPVRQKAYQPFGDLRVSSLEQGHATNYVRELLLDSAIAMVSYEADGVQYKRVAFASYPDHAIVLHFSASKPGRLSFTLKMDSPQTNSQTTAVDKNTLALTGQVEPEGLRFESRVRVLNKGGLVLTNGGGISIEKADAVTLILTAATSFKNFQDISAEPSKRCALDLENASKKSFEALVRAHETDHRHLFEMVSVDLGHSQRETLPTDQRLALVKDSGLESDPALAALEFQYGRYLLISCSRPGGQPANLQGIWNELLAPPWESKWTVNINCQMNYWPAEVANLSECAEPLFDMLDDLVVSGQRTAKEQYGCRGWVLHHNTDLWRGTAPINNIDGVWPTGGAWLCEHLWEHYLFTGDKSFLAKRAYPIIKEASLFFVDFLIEDPKTKWLVTSPSFSPEQGPLTIGPTMDEQIIRGLMGYTIQAAAILGIDSEFAGKLKEVRSRLAPNQIGKNGQLQEWLDDVDRPNNNHRHMSPLWALYPGEDITPADPKIFEAAKVLLRWRGDGSTGWSYAWRIPLWGRVGDGDFAFRQLSGLLQKRTLPNLFDLCGPFQIDGNFGATAGIAELLLQSHLTTQSSDKDGVRIIDLLPALPKAWPSGSVTGLCGRDGFEVALTWDKGALTRAVVRSKLGKQCRIRYGAHTADLTTSAGKVYAFNGSLEPAK
jgi:alpha-L-fucosidase 2